LYLRDFVKENQKGNKIGTVQVLKMACLMEIFGLPDCAAELLIEFRPQLVGLIDVDFCLDLLTQNIGAFPNYKSHVDAFCNNPESFYPKPLQINKCIVDDNQDCSVTDSRAKSCVNDKKFSVINKFWSKLKKKMKLILN